MGDDEGGVQVADAASQEIDAILNNANDWRGATLGRVREVVLAAAPTIVEDVKWKKPSKPEGVPVWSCDGIICIGEMLKSAVRLTFPKGAQLSDPDGIFNTRLSSKTVRAVDFAEGEPVPEAAVQALIVEAIAVNAAR
jgi:hypothetical protein